MKKSYQALFLLLIIVPSASVAYGHGVSTGIMGRPVVVDYEQVSDQSVTTDDVVIISGQFVSRSDKETKLLPYIYVTHDALLPQHTNLLAIIYPPLKDQSTWYFRVEHSMPNPVVVGPGESIDYEMKIYPLKAGSYHVHTFFLADYGPGLSRGWTMIVTGQTMPTAGEITQLYLPLAFGVAAISALTLLAFRRIHAQTADEKAIRIYYIIKSSYETVWLSGVVFWLTTATYLTAEKYGVVVVMTAGLAAITIGGYVAAGAKSRKVQRLFAMGTSAATVALYLTLTTGDYPAIDNQFQQFNQDGLIIITALVGNTLAAILIFVLELRSRKRPAEILHN